MEEGGLQLHPDKTRVVYCKDSGRKGSAEFEQFTFLGYTFRPRLAKSTKNNTFFVSALLSTKCTTPSFMVTMSMPPWLVPRKSTARLIDLFALDATERDKLLTAPRTRSTLLQAPGRPPAVIRDQKPMKFIKDGAEILRCGPVQPPNPDLAQTQRAREPTWSSATGS